MISVTVDGSHVERFVRVVHRRMVLLRLIERVGLAVLVGCGLALVFLPVLIWRGEGDRGMVFVLACVGLGVFAGMLWGIARRPGRLWAAVEADRQLKLADLLGTALYLLRSRDSLDEMGRSVLATAEGRCAALSPSAVILNRIGARGWGGIGLAVAMVLTVALVGAGDRAARAGASRAAAGTMSSWRDSQVVDAEGNQTRVRGGPDFRRVRPGEGGDEEPGMPGTVTPSQGGKGGVAEAGAGGEAVGSEAGTGAGAGQSGNQTEQGKGLETAVGKGRGSGGGVEVSSGGTGAAANGTDDARAGNSAGGTGRAAAAPVWKSNEWAADRAAALRAVEGGRVPDGYRDLVRDYFERR
jgi:hypothetical protein